MVIEVVKDLLYFFIFLGIIWLGFACAVLSFQVIMRTIPAMVA